MHAKPGYRVGAIHVTGFQSAPPPHLHLTTSLKAHLYWSESESDVASIGLIKNCFRFRSNINEPLLNKHVAE